MSNHDLMELNELNQNSKGGTELLMQRLYDGVVPRELLEQFQIVFSRVRELDPERKHIFYGHDLPQDPESVRLSDPLFRKKFEKFVWVSNWQMEQYNSVRGVEYGKSVVIKNSIEPLDTSKRTTSDKIRLIYHTTPHRGLGILVPVFVELAKHHDDIQLDVYSSFNIYGWGQRDEEFKSLFDICKEHPAINYHGAVSNEEVREALLNADIFAYPSIWKETSCLALIEAMSAGLLCVHPNYAALTETAMGLTWMYQWNEDFNTHANIFYSVLNQAITVMRNNKEEIQADLRLQKIQVDRVHNWGAKANEWTALLDSLKNK
jgi:glycosyltransferase involved in cell wall biosynthesis